MEDKGKRFYLYGVTDTESIMEESFKTQVALETYLNSMRWNSVMVIYGVECVVKTTLSLSKGT